MRDRERWGWALLPILLVVLLIPLQRQFQWKQFEADLRSCRSNLKNLGTACEMYSTDNTGRYPCRLSVLAPQYLRQLPVCPAAEQDTYSEGYLSVSNPDWYTAACAGDWHPSLRPGERLQYPATMGTCER